VTIPRGWISVDGKLRGKDFRFVTTHLDGFDPRVQAAQASELVQGPQGPGNTNLPVIIAGDLNVAPLRLYLAAALRRSIHAVYNAQSTTGSRPVPERANRLGCIDG
jgi:endonuclease/exonuclease/phosphatase family metal-dependent hydrolase